ncbi:MAG: hypothetical protein EOM62_17990 [Bacteroidia bacterium]|nr:hypothetical protein [Bacteroidia bacterium]
MEWLNNALVQQALMWAIPVVLPFILGGIVWLLKKGIDLLAAKIKESETKVDDYLLGVAVKFAEDKFGPDTGTGPEKLSEACDYIEEVTKGKLKADTIEPLVRAKYVEIFGALSKLKNG